VIKLTKNLFQLQKWFGGKSLKDNQQTLREGGMHAFYGSMVITMLLWKQLSKELLKNRVFTLLIWVLCTFTSFMFFFVHFSVDGNMAKLKGLSALSKNQQLYFDALSSNTILAANMLLALILLTSFAFAMFFHHFFAASARQIGSLRALGFKNSSFYKCFGTFTVMVSLIGAVTGLGLGYLFSDVLLNANMKSYSVTMLVKSISPLSFAIGVFIPAAVFCLVSICSYYVVGRKEVGALLSCMDKQKLTQFTRIADRVVKILPIKNKFPLRIALRNPVTVVLIVTAVMSFTVMFVLGYSLTLSSIKIYNSQTKGHFYRYETVFDTFKTEDHNSDNALYYIHTEGKIEKTGDKKEISQEIIGIENSNHILALENEKQYILDVPKTGKIYISPALKEMYGIQIGDTVTLTISEKEYVVSVSDIAANAKEGAVYMSKNQLAKIMNLPQNAFTGVLSMERLYDDGTVTTYEQKKENLERASVSNQNSAIINQVIGCSVGCILLFLGLLLNFQDNIKDMLILHSIGYSPKEIRKLFIDIYLPLIWASFLITLAPSIFTAYSIQRSLSLQMEDYLPFQINAAAIFIIFILLNILYFLVQAVFSFALKRVVQKEN
jgi:putative ABC transport system permease protein